MRTTSSRPQFKLSPLLPLIVTELFTLGGPLCQVCVCVCVCLCVFVCVYVFDHSCMCMCVITPVNTEKCEAPVPSRRARGRQQPQEPQDSVSPLGSPPGPSLAPALLLQCSVGRKETCCVCSAGGAAAPAHMGLTVHAGPGFPPC